MLLIWLRTSNIVKLNALTSNSHIIKMRQQLARKTLRKLYITNTDIKSIFRTVSVAKELVFF